MPLLQHLWDWVWFLVIVLGPIPFCLWIVTITAHQATLRLTHCGLVILTIWCSLETAIVLSLGAVHALKFHFIISTEIIVFLVGLILFNASRSRFPSFLAKIRSDFVREEFVISGAFVFVFLNLLIQAIITPITNYDSLAYHLPAIAEWYQSGYFTVLDQFKLELIGYYPYSWEALCLLFLFPFREDILVTFPNLIAWLILGGATYLTSQQFAAQRVYSLAATFFVLTLPILVHSINTIHVDLPFAAFFVSAFYFLLVWWSSRFVPDFVLFLLSLGMMLGIKTSSIPYAALLILVLLLCPVLLPKPSMPWFSRLNQRSQGFVLLGSGIALLLGSFWYIKNLLFLGNPFGLLRIQFFGTQLFSGTIDPDTIRQTTLAYAFRWLNPSDWLVVIKQVGVQYGIPFSLIVLQLLVFAATVTFRPCYLKKLTVPSLILLGILTVSITTLYCNTPYSGSNDTPPRLTSWMGQGLRYAFSGVALLGVLSAIASSLISLRKELITAACVLSSLVFWINFWT